MRPIYTLPYIICINSISVNCEWGNWYEGDCSTTCGIGEQTNIRIKLVEEAMEETALEVIPMLHLVSLLNARVCI